MIFFKQKPDDIKDASPVFIYFLICEKRNVNTAIIRPQQKYLRGTCPRTQDRKKVFVSWQHLGITYKEGK